jgi:succinate dehydrogenase flavin-adding protein (antitoxin of CptAB toxin-antitoxin module)
MQHPNDKIEAKYNTDAGVSKEDEDRYHSLLAENDDLQKLIAAVSSCEKYNQEQLKKSWNF